MAYLHDPDNLLSKQQLKTFKNVLDDYLGVKQPQVVDNLQSYFYPEITKGGATGIMNPPKKVSPLLGRKAANVGDVFLPHEIEFATQGINRFRTPEMIKAGAAPHIKDFRYIVTHEMGHVSDWENQWKLAKEKGVSPRKFRTIWTSEPPSTKEYRGGLDHFKFLRERYGKDALGPAMKRHFLQMEENFMVGSRYKALTGIAKKFGLLGLLLAAGLPMMMGKKE